MVRKKTKQPLLPVDNWTRADELVRMNGDLDVQIAKAEASCKKKIDVANAELAKVVEPLNKEIDLNFYSIEAFAVNHQKDFGNNRSRKLNHGLLGWRKSTKISIKTDTTLDLIKQVFKGAKRKSLITVKESPDKNALAKLTDEQLASINARRKPKDDFFVEPNLPKAINLEK